jgi:hypothetical protein
MGSVREFGGPAWVAHGALAGTLSGGKTAWSYPASVSLPGISAARGGTVYDIFASDWFYVGLTIVVFGVLWLLVKGVERFER